VIRNVNYNLLLAFVKFADVSRFVN